MKALLLSAGLGTRLKPFTDKHPKALAPVHGRSLLEWNIRNLQRFNTLHQENGFGSRFEISDESDAVLETGGGLKKAAPFFNQEQNLLVMNVDMLTNADIGKMISQHKQSDRLATLAVQQRQTSRYFLFDESMRLKGWENTLTHERKPSGITGNLKQFAFSGIQILSTEIFTKITREGKFSLVDVYLDLCTTENIIGLDHTGDLLLDVGKPESIAQAETLFSAIH
jgi:NDP-sugar pyrophosphorylase family protein